MTSPSALEIMDLFSTNYVVLGTVTKKFIVNCFVNIVDVKFGHLSLFGKWLPLLPFSSANLRSRDFFHQASLTQPGSFSI